MVDSAASGEGSQSSVTETSKREQKDLTLGSRMHSWFSDGLQRNCFMEDADLVRLCQDGDMAAFEQLFRTYQERIHSVAFRMMSNQEDALDLTQEIFLKA